MRPIFLAGLAALSAFSSGAAQSIGGRILDKTSRSPLARVSVQLVPDTGAVSTVIARTTTDSSGIFYMEAPALGTYRLVLGLSNASVLVPLAVKESFVQQEYLIDVAAERSYFVFEVEKMVELLPNQRPPKYPESMRAANLDGEVLVQFVVNAEGRPEMWTFKVLRSPHHDFTESVRETVALLRFKPAELGGQKVKQLVQMPFVFDRNR